MDSELRKRFNPDGSLLRRQQLRMLELLEVIDVICRKHQIPYWLSKNLYKGIAGIKPNITGKKLDEYEALTV